MGTKNTHVDRAVESLDKLKGCIELLRTNIKAGEPDNPDADDLRETEILITCVMGFGHAVVALVEATLATAFVNA